MNAPAKRRFWRIHLSSAVLMMLAAGAVVGLNLRHRPYPHIAVRGGVSAFGLWYRADQPIYAIGWPMTCLETHRMNRSYWDEMKSRYYTAQYPDMEPLMEEGEGGSGYIYRPMPTPTVIQQTWSWFRALAPLIVNVLAGITVIAFMAIVNEWRIRRRVHA